MSIYASRFKQIVGKAIQSLTGKNSKPIKFNFTFRDAIQSNLGTNPSADEMLEMLNCAEEAGYNSIQISGGTFFNLMIDKGRDAWKENEKLFEKVKNMKTTALIRDDFLVGYERNHESVIDSFIEQLAELGLDEVTNFHGMNDTRMQEGVFKAVKKAREKGHEIYAPKVICVGDNPNLSIALCMDALRRQRNMADEGIYLKNANGKGEPGYYRELIAAIAKEFPGETIKFHSHNNHGLAYANTLAVVEAATEYNVDLEIDVAADPLSEGTAQISDIRAKELIDNHPNPDVRARSPECDPSKVEPDYNKMYETRFGYRDTEMRYSKRVWDALFKAGMAGGATATLKGVPGLLQNIMAAIGTKDEEEAIIAVCQAEEEVSQQLGHPTKVTPYQKMQTEAGVYKILQGAGIMSPYKTHPAKSYLQGQWGAVAASASKALIREFNGDGVENFVPASELPLSMNEIKAKYPDKNLSDRDAIVLSLREQGDDLGKGEQYLEKIENGTLERLLATLPKWPTYLAPLTKGYQFDPKGVGTKHDVAMALGGPAELEKFAQSVCFVQKHKDGFYKTRVGVESVYERRRAQRGLDPAQHSEADAYLASMYAKWSQDEFDKAQKFVAGINQKLENYGFTDRHKTGALNTVNQILADAVDKKAKGASEKSMPQFTVSHISNTASSNANVEMRPLV